MQDTPRNLHEIVSQLTIEEKVSLLSGANFWHTKPIERLGIPSIMMTDGPHGLRKQGGKEDHLGLNQSVPATCFPTAAALANSWDPNLAQAIGAALGAEAAHHGVAMVLGPGLNIVRDPLAGRAFEYFSEDPFLAGEMAAGSVRGIQANGVAATVKHFAVNSQEHVRMSVDEIVDERSLREIYLEGFRRAIQNAQPKALMTSYNKVNGTYSNENTHLLSDILFGEWGFKGMPVTDWGGMNDPVAAARAGAVLEMPSSFGISDAELLDALKAGTLDEATVDARVESLLRLVFDTSEAIKNVPAVNYDAHHALATRASSESTVLLKNAPVTGTDDVNATPLLPLRPGVKVAVVGDFAQTPRYQGAGSSLVNPTKVTNALESFKNSSVEVAGFASGFERTGKHSASKVREAVQLAKTADITVVFLGLDEAKESEGIDRQTMALPANQLELMSELERAGVKNLVVVLSAGGVLELPFADSVPAILHTFLGGQGSGTATVALLTGLMNPSGKLAVTSPIVYEDAPTAKYFPGREATAVHREGLYVGYRYYETVGMPVRYPFGHGLSYTQFEYADIEVSRQQVSFTLKNTGTMAGAEIAQVYVRPVNPAVFRPAHELKGFSKVMLDPGASKRVTIPFDAHSFAYFSPQDNAWVTDAGEYEIEVSASVRDVRLRARVAISSAEATPRTAAPTDMRALLPSYYSGNVQAVSDAEYETLLGRPLPPALWNRTVKPRYHDTVAQLQYGRLSGRIFLGMLKGFQRILFAMGRPNDANNIVFILNMTFAKFPRFSGGRISEKWLRKYLRDKK